MNNSSHPIQALHESIQKQEWGKVLEALDRREWHPLLKNEYQGESWLGRLMKQSDSPEVWRGLLMDHRVPLWNEGLWDIPASDLTAWHRVMGQRVAQWVENHKVTVKSHPGWRGFLHVAWERIQQKEESAARRESQETKFREWLALGMTHIQSREDLIEWRQWIDRAGLTKEWNAEMKAQWQRVEELGGSLYPMTTAEAIQAYENEKVSPGSWMNGWWARYREWMVRPGVQGAKQEEKDLALWNTWRDMMKTWVMQEYGQKGINEDVEGQKNESVLEDVWRRVSSVWLKHFMKQPKESSMSGLSLLSMEAWERRWGPWLKDAVEGTSELNPKNDLAMHDSIVKGIQESKKPWTLQAWVRNSHYGESQKMALGWGWWMWSHTNHPEIWNALKDSGVLSDVPRALSTISVENPTAIKELRERLEESVSRNINWEQRLWAIIKRVETIESQDDTNVLRMKESAKGVEEEMNVSDQGLNVFLTLSWEEQCQKASEAWNRVTTSTRIKEKIDYGVRVNEWWMMHHLMRTHMVHFFPKAGRLFNESTEVIQEYRQHYEQRCLWALEQTGMLEKEALHEVLKHFKSSEHNAERKVFEEPLAKIFNHSGKGKPQESLPFHEALEQRMKVVKERMYYQAALKQAEEDPEKTVEPKVEGLRIKRL